MASKRSRRPVGIAYRWHRRLIPWSLLIYDLLAWEVDVWIYGLPPPGPLGFVVEWPARGIPETRAEVDARLVLDAAAQAAPISPGQQR